MSAQFIDAQPLAVLGDAGGHLADAQPGGEQALLVVVDRLLPAAHQVQVGAAGEDQLHLATVLGKLAAGTLDLLGVAGVEEEQRARQRHHFERVHARARCHDQAPLGIADRVGHLDARIEMKGPSGRRASDARYRSGIFDLAADAGLALALQALQATVGGEFAQIGLDEGEQARLGDRVHRADHAQVLGVGRGADCRGCDREQQCRKAGPVRRSHGPVR
jgi:hypothetical protein